MIVQVHPMPHNRDVATEVDTDDLLASGWTVAVTPELVVCSRTMFGPGGAPVTFGLVRAET